MLEKLTFVQNYFFESLKNKLNHPNVFRSFVPQDLVNFSYVVLDFKNIQNIPSYFNNLFEISFEILVSMHTQPKNLLIAHKVYKILNSLTDPSASNQVGIVNIDFEKIAVKKEAELLLCYKSLIKI